MQPRAERSRSPDPKTDQSQQTIISIDIPIDQYAIYSGGDFNPGFDCAQPSHFLWMDRWRYCGRGVTRFDIRPKYVGDSSHFGSKPVSSIGSILGLAFHDRKHPIHVQIAQHRPMLPVNALTYGLPRDHFDVAIDDEVNFWCCQYKRIHHSIPEYTCEA
jgi:hypothetical protein